MEKSINGTNKKNRYTYKVHWFLTKTPSQFNRERRIFSKLGFISAGYSYGKKSASTPTSFDTKISIRWNIDNTQHKVRKPLDENTEVHLNNIDVRGFLRTKTHERKERKKNVWKKKNVFIKFRTSHPNTPFFF